MIYHIEILEKMFEFHKNNFPYDIKTLIVLANEIFINKTFLFLKEKTI
jgi:hypothetical protein